MSGSVSVWQRREDTGTNAGLHVPRRVALSRVVCPGYRGGGRMKRSTERILTTHTGSLARPPELLQMLLAREEGQPVDPGVFDATVRRAVAEKVKRQVEVGLAVVNDGEQSKISFATYIMQRLQGFGGADEPR